MNKTFTLSNDFTQAICTSCINQKQADIASWLLGYEKEHTPIYTSVDIRDAGYKIAVVDTNLYPAGFNNICEHGLANAVKFIKPAILKRVPNAKNIIIAAEEHTRNTWYLENVRILEQIIKDAGFEVRIATFFAKEPSFCEQAAHAIELETATGATVKIHCFKHILNKINQGAFKTDAIIMNNDLSAGIPEALLNANIPVFPSMHAGWHARLKSEHFKFTNKLIQELASIVGIDPWLMSCLYRSTDEIDIQQDTDRQKLYTIAADLFTEITKKHEEYDIKTKPYIILKADAGTYGLGVIPIEDPAEILKLNSRKRNDLSRGKGNTTTSRFILQEGVPTIHRLEGNPSEVCIYQIDNNFIGGFYRYHTSKNERESLNSPGGMSFQKMCPSLDKYGQDCGLQHNMNVFDVYRILARVAGIAASREIKDLEGKIKWNLSS